MRCLRSNRELINPYELIRKHKCLECGEVMMCSCDKELGQYYVPHQLGYGTSLNTQDHIPVTIGFQDNICPKCRNEVLPAYPRKGLYGSSSKIKRYYWREIQFEYIRLFKEYADKKGVYKYDEAIKKFPKEFASCKERALVFIKKIHEKRPLYVFDEPSQKDIIENYQVEVINYKCTYKKSDTKKASILYKEQTYTAEEYVQERYKEQGYQVVLLESVPIHVIFATFMYQLIEDLSDPRVRVCMFGDRKEKGKLIYANLPDDFGTSGFYKRREKEIEKWLEEINYEKEELLWLFNYWVNDEYSGTLRQYLWAFKEEKIQIARLLVQILPGDCIKKILRYLIQDYFSRYCGWPDLFCYNNIEYLLLEVKTSGDKLSDDQRNWIKGNYQELKMPFKLIKLNRTNMRAV